MSANMSLETMMCSRCDEGFEPQEKIVNSNGQLWHIQVRYLLLINFKTSSFPLFSASFVPSALGLSKMAFFTSLKAESIAKKTFASSSLLTAINAVTL